MKKKQWITPEFKLISENPIKKNGLNNLEIHNGNQSQITINGNPAKVGMGTYNSAHS